jgi:peptide/nickel transport system permease protein
MSRAIAAAPESRRRPALLSRMARIGGHIGFLPGAALIVLALIVLSTLLAPLLSSHDPLELDPVSRLMPPDADHWFGTDGLGRDVLARTLYGGRVSLLVGAGVAVASTLFGLAIGMVAGFSRITDNIVMRIMDGLMAIPGILLAAALLAVSRPGIVTVIVAISVPEVPRTVRLVRSMVLSLREQTYIEAAIMSGARLPRLMLRHILPNIMAPIVVQATFSFAVAILLESYLSLLGAGIPPAVPSWGNIITDAANTVRIAFWPIGWPGLFVGLTVLSVNILGDRLRDYLDPRFVGKLRG